MENIDPSCLNLTDSYYSNSNYSECTSFLNSKISTQNIESMEKNCLFSKLLYLCQTLENTEKDNQLLRIEKAQLRGQLKNCKLQVQNFIQSSLIASEAFKQRALNYDNWNGSVSNSGPQSVKQEIIPSFSTFDQQQKSNKVFVKSHRRENSNHFNSSDRNTCSDQKKQYNTLVNSPSKQNFNTVENQTISKQPNTHKKIKFSQNSLNNLILIEQDSEQKEQYSPQNQILQNFESFYCQKADDFRETKRNTAHFYQKKFKTAQNQNRSAQSYQNSDRIDKYQLKDTKLSRQKNNLIQFYELGQKYQDNSKNFTIPNSIQQIWGVSNAGVKQQSFFQKNKLVLTHASANKFFNLSNKDSIKPTIFQRKTFLNF